MAAAGVLYHHDIATRWEVVLFGQRHLGALVVRRTRQEDGKAPRRVGTIDVGSQTHAIARAHRLVLFDYDLVSGLTYLAVGHCYRSVAPSVDLLEVLSGASINWILDSTKGLEHPGEKSQRGLLSKDDQTHLRSRKASTRASRVSRLRHSYRAALASVCFIVKYGGLNTNFCRQLFVAPDSNNGLWSACFGSDTCCLWYPPCLTLSQRMQDVLSGRPRERRKGWRGAHERQRGT